MRLLKLLIAVSICLYLSAVAFAHSGGTDSNGGHIDNSTGGYHYHHGYPAHQHWDMDGDGYLDCPYLFDDETESSGNKTDVPSQKAESEKKSNTAKKIKEYFLPIACSLGLYGGIWLYDKIKWRIRK